MILASASPRRAEILAGLGITFEIHAAEIQELPVEGEAPEEQAVRLATQKAVSVANLRSGEWVLGGDTLVTIDGTILGKPIDREQTVQMLLGLQGRTHRVVSGVALARCEPGGGSEVAVISECSVTAVTFRSFGEDTALRYAKTGESTDKAGGYAIQGLGAALVERIDGDYSGVVGLPVPSLLALLERAGMPYRFGG